MTALFSNGFGQYAVAADLVTYGFTNDGGNTYDATGGYQSAPCFRINAASTMNVNGFLSPAFAAPGSNELRFGFYLKTVASAPGSSSNLSNESFQFILNALTSRCGLSRPPRLHWFYRHT